MTCNSDVSWPDSDRSDLKKDASESIGKLRQRFKTHPLSVSVTIGVIYGVYEGYHFLDCGTVPSLFRTQVKNLLSPAAIGMKLNYPKIEFDCGSAPDPAREFTSRLGAKVRHVLSSELVFPLFRPKLRPWVSTIEEHQIFSIQCWYSLVELDNQSFFRGLSALWDKCASKRSGLPLCIHNTPCSAFHIGYQRRNIEDRGRGGVIHRKRAQLSFSLPA